MRQGLFTNPKRQASLLQSRTRALDLEVLVLAPYSAANIELESTGLMKKTGHHLQKEEMKSCGSKIGLWPLATPRNSIHKSYEVKW